MKVTISFKHLDHTPSLDERIHEKSERLSKYFDGKSHIKWNCSVKEGTHYAEIDLSGPNYSYHATASSDNLYKSFDLVVAKIERQVQKKKEKTKIKKGKISHRDLEILDPENAWMDYEDDQYNHSA